MDFLKKHYEKIILIAVLLGVVGFLVFLPIVISRDQEEMNDKRTVIIPNPQPIPELVWTNQKAVLERLQSPANFDFSGKNNKLFNPVEWKKDQNGNLIKLRGGDEIGAGAAVVTKIMPLNLVVTLELVQTNELGATYVLSVSNSMAATPQLRRKQQHYVSKADPKNNAFTLTTVKGAPENPDQLIVKMADTGELAAISKDKPFQRLDGYSADIKYDLEKKTFPGRRVGQMISFNNEGYIIVAIGADSVIVSAQSNQKKTTLRYSP
jgi:hypothetical protein